MYLQENDVSRRVQVAVDEELQQYTELEQEKLQLEAHVAEIERSIDKPILLANNQESDHSYSFRARAEDITSHQSELGQLEDRVRTAESAKVGLSVEIGM